MKSERSVAEWALGVLVLLQCVGAAWWWLRDGSQLGVPFVAQAIVFLGLVAVIRPSAAWLLPIAGVMFLEALFAVARADGYAGRMSLLSQAIRYGGPLALWLLARGDERWARTVLRWTIAAVFLAHGIKALVLHPPFLSYIEVSIDKVFGVVLHAPVTATATFLIGVIDVILAVLVVLRPSKPVLAYMIFWGFLTASMRMIYFGVDGGACFTLVRALNGGAPLVLYLFTMRPTPLTFAPDFRERVSV
ncbi:MAG: hypothetical protein RIT81_39545 [Deltaproteobacteria bacterium]